MRGHVYRKKRPDGSYSRWYAVSDVPPGPDGKRRQQTTTHDTKREAQAALAERIGKINKGMYHEAKVTVGQYLNEWLASKAALRPTTSRSYEFHLRLYLVPHLGRLRLADLRPVHIEAMYAAITTGNAQRERPVGPATLRRIHATLMSAMNTAVRKHLLPYNPAQYVELPAAPTATAKVWTPQQVSTFLRQTADDRLIALYHVIAYRGLRRGEAVGLRWQDVDLVAGHLHVRQQVVQLGHATQIGEPKTKRGYRTVSLDEDTIAALRTHRARQNEERMAMGPAWIDTGLVFTREDGDQLHPAYVTKHFVSLTGTVGLPRIRLHELRHTSASLGLEAGESLKEVSDRLGHSGIGITANIYTHVSPAMASRSAQQLADLVAGTRG